MAMIGNIAVAITANSMGLTQGLATSQAQLQAFSSNIQKRIQSPYNAYINDLKNLDTSLSRGLLSASDHAAGLKLVNRAYAEGAGPMLRMKIASETVKRSFDAWKGPLANLSTTTMPAVKSAMQSLSRVGPASAQAVGSSMVGLKTVGTKAASGFDTLRNSVANASTTFPRLASASSRAMSAMRPGLQSIKEGAADIALPFTWAAKGVQNFGVRVANLGGGALSSISTRLATATGSMSGFRASVRDGAADIVLPFTWAASKVRGFASAVVAADGGALSSLSARLTTIKTRMTDFAASSYRSVGASAAVQAATKRVSGGLSELSSRMSGVSAATSLAVGSLISLGSQVVTLGRVVGSAFSSIGNSADRMLNAMGPVGLALRIAVGPAASFVSNSFIGLSKTLSGPVTLGMSAVHNAASKTWASLANGSKQIATMSSTAGRMAFGVSSITSSMSRFGSWAYKSSGAAKVFQSALYGAGNSMSAVAPKFTLGSAAASRSVGMWGSLINKIFSFGRGIGSVFAGIGARATPALAVVTGVGKGIGTAFSVMGAFVRPVIGTIGAFGSAIKILTGGALSVLGTGVSAVGGVLKGVLVPAFSAVGSVASGVFGFLAGGISTVWNIATGAARMALNFGMVGAAMGAIGAVKVAGDMELLRNGMTT